MLLFCPGLICDARIYAPQTAVFSGSKAIDGYGLADTLEQMAAIVLEQAPERFDLFGHSMGGRVALEVYRAAPDRVRRLALVSTGTHLPPEGEAAKRAATQAIGYNHGFEALVDAWLTPMIAEANRGTLYEPLKAMCLEQGQDKYDAQVHALLHRPDVAGLLPRIACPTLVMTGEHDAWSPPEQHRWIAAAIPGAQLVIVPGAGHMIPLEAPAEVNAAIRDWLSVPADD